MAEEHTPKVVAALDRLNSRRTDLLDFAKRLFRAGNDGLYTVDTFAIGATKRTASLMAGFDLLVRDWNIVCARALLRMQIDTALRFGALTLVDDHDAFIQAVLEGQRIDKLKDRSGHPLTDKYLVECFQTKVPWLPEVYKRTSGYVHLSGEHVFASVHGLDEMARKITWAIGPRDDNFPEFSWLELVDCFETVVGMFVGLLDGWVQIKARLPTSPPGAA